MIDDENKCLNNDEIGGFVKFKSDDYAT